MIGTLASRRAGLRLTPAGHSLWPEFEFEELLRDGVADGRRMLLRLAEEWRAGSNHFARPGERLIAAWADHRLVGCGGRTVEPDLGTPDTGRVRRLYVIANSGGAASGGRCSRAYSTTPGSTSGS